MNFGTLLEAAEYLEWRSHTKARDDDDDEYQVLVEAHSPSPNNGSDTSSEAFYSVQPYSHDSSQEEKEKRRAGGAGTREVHNKLEKNRRAHLKECFDFLKCQIPNMEEKKISNLSILRGSLRFIQVLKRREKENELEAQKLEKQKIQMQNRLLELNMELSKMNIKVDINHWMDKQKLEEESNSTSTASEGEVQVVNAPTVNNPEKTKIYLKKKTVLEKSPIILPASTIPTVVAMPMGIPVTIIPDIVTATISTSTAVLSSSVMHTYARKTTPKPTLPLMTNQMRTPVAQILHQTLTQRLSLQRLQSNMQKTNPSDVTSIHASTVHPTSQVLKTFATRPRFPPLNAIPNVVESNSHLAAINKLASAVTVPVSSTANYKAVISSIATPITNVSGTTMLAASSTKVFSHPFLFTNTLTTSAGPLYATVPTATAQTTMSSNLTKLQMLQTARFPNPVSNTAAISMASIPRYIAATPPAGGQLISAAQLTTLNPLLAQSLARTTSTPLLTSITNYAGANTATTASSVQPLSQQVMSFTHVTPVTRIFTHLPTVTTPAVQMTATGLTHAQLGSVLGQPILKQLNQLPFLSQQFLQTGQVIGQQQVVKPLVVMTTLPSAVVTTTAENMPPARSTS